MKGYQQGDVLMVKESGIPEGAKKVEARLHAGRPVYVLAEGEVTGHAHVVEATPEIELFEKDGTLYMRVEGETQVRHEEHTAQKLDAGTYRIGIVKEVDPFSEEVRSVAD